MDVVTQGEGLVVSQEARDAAADYALDHWLWPAPHVADLRRGGPAWDTYHLTQAFQRAIDAAGARQREAVIAFLREQSELGADYGIAADKGTTKRAAFGGGSLALKRAADTIEAGEHMPTAAIRALATDAQGEAK